MELRTGDEIAGKYRIVSRLGGGNMGSVYEAEHIYMPKRFAIKVLHSDVAMKETNVERFRREAEAACALDHPNICTAVDFGELASGELYFVMERLNGETLTHRLSAVGRLSPLDASFIMRQLLSALQCASEHGVVHRDVKPDNMMLTTKNGAANIVKLFDFGIAHVDPVPGREGGTLTHAGEIYGTPQYMAPEQIVGDCEIDARADLYAAGCVFFEMLTGKTVFVGANYVELFHCQLSEKPPHIDDSIDQHEKFDTIVQKLLEKDPANRYQTAADAIADLDKVIISLSGNPLEFVTSVMGGQVLSPSQEIDRNIAARAVQAAQNAQNGAKNTAHSAATAVGVAPVTQEAMASGADQANASDKQATAGANQANDADRSGLDAEETLKPAKGKPDLRKITITITDPKALASSITADIKNLIPKDIKADLRAAIPKTEGGKRGLIVIVAVCVIGVLLALALILAFNKVLFGPGGDTVESIDDDTGTVIYQEAQKAASSKPQPYNYDEKYKISYDSELSKDQNVVSAAENLLAGNYDQALVSLQAVKSTYMPHPNFKRLYLVALYSVKKADRDYDEIYTVLVDLLKVVPDASRNPSVAEIVYDFMNSRDQYKRMTALLQEHMPVTEIARLIISSPFDRYEVRKERLLATYDAMDTSRVPKWLKTGVAIWRTGVKDCRERLEILEAYGEVDQELYENVLLPLDSMKKCYYSKFMRKDCHGCLRDFIDVEKTRRSAK